MPLDSCANTSHTDSRLLLPLTKRAWLFLLSLFSLGALPPAHLSDNAFHHLLSFFSCLPILSFSYCLRLDDEASFEFYFLCLSSLLYIFISSAFICLYLYFSLFYTFLHFLISFFLLNSKLHLRIFFFSKHADSSSAVLLSFFPSFSSKSTSSPLLSSYYDLTFCIDCSARYDG